MNLMKETKLRIAWVTILSIAFAFVEASVVVYLRRIYYPDGFRFPLNAIADNMLIVELFREFATMVMLCSIGALAGRKFWERFAYFMLSFGVWDIFYYVWLKIAINWPSSLGTWDILFLIPLPWIGPVMAPISVSVLLIGSGVLIIHLHDNGYDFRPDLVSWILSIIGVFLILFSFMSDTAASLRQQMPKPYGYAYLAVGDILLVAAFVISYQKTKTRRRLN